MSIELITGLTPALMADVLREAGCRAVVTESAGMTLVESALQGVGFAVVFGNRPGESAEAAVDAAFRCVLRVQGEIPAALTERWNRERRFARLVSQGEALVLVMDLMVAGGVSRGWLKGQIELWDLVLRDYLHFLQAPAPQAA